MLEDERDPTLRVRRDLAEIARLTGWLEEHAAARPNDRAMPGGEAMEALGPISPLNRWDAVEFFEMWNAQHYGEYQVDLSHLNDEPGDPEAETLTSLLFWTDAWRRETGSRVPTRPTLAGEALWLASAMDWAWDNEPHFYDFADDVNGVRQHLENLMRRGHRTSKSRVPCLDCDGLEHRPRLILVYQDDVEADYHKCPVCKRRYDKKSFDLAMARHMGSETAQKFVKLQDARDVITHPDRPDGARPLRTFRKWLKEGLIKTERDPKTGLVMVWWPDVRYLDLTTPRRNRESVL